QKDDETIAAGTNDSEVIIATKETNVTTGAGDDTIYTSSADDVITVDGSGDKTIVIDTNTGVDTIVMANSEAKVYLNTVNIPSYSSGNRYYKSKDADNNDLIIEAYYNSNSNEITKRMIIKDYFVLSDEVKANIFVRNYNNYGNYASLATIVRNLNISGDEGEENTNGFFSFTGKSYNKDT
ncbi:MAG: hypothetical protein J6Z11_11090, partial [Candidatus Riflebacteria bacterium]|nr:hypothetical protein [Candidatus Riflebacteria bacterium]